MTNDPKAVPWPPRPPPATAATAAATALTRRLAVASALAVLGAALCYLFMVRTSLGQRIDDAAFLGARANDGSSAQAADTDLLRRITADSLALVLLILVGIGAARRRVLLGLGGAFAAGVAVVGTHLLKNEILTRPDLTPAGLRLGGNTFPSGHTATAVACAMALVLVCAPRWRGAAAVIAGAYGWITAAQVQTAGWHRPSDAVGAAFIAFASVTAVAAVLAAREPGPPIWTGPSPDPAGAPARTTAGPTPWVALVILGLVGVADVVVCARTLVRVLGFLHAHAMGVPVSAGIDHDAYITGLTVTIAVVVLLLMVLLLLLDGAELGGRLRTSRPAGAEDR